MQNQKIISETVKREKYGVNVDIHRLSDSWFIYQHCFQRPGWYISNLFYLSWCII